MRAEVASTDNTNKIIHLVLYRYILIVLYILAQAMENLSSMMQMPKGYLPTDPPHTSQLLRSCVLNKNDSK